jgi:hypothetical protein
MSGSNRGPLPGGEGPAATRGPSLTGGARLASPRRVLGKNEGRLPPFLFIDKAGALSLLFYPCQCVQLSGGACEGAHLYYSKGAHCPSTAGAGAL